MVASTPEATSGEWKTFNDIIQAHASHKAEKKVYFLLDDEGEEIDSITYAELFRNTILQAHNLRKSFKKGDRCILIFQPGLELIISLLACFYSGIIAVPVNPPKRNKVNKRFWAILSDCTPSAIMMDKENQQLLEKHFDDRRELDDMLRISLERSNVNFSDETTGFGIEQEDIAFLQYTSGSTGLPKGVMVSHGNLMHNSEVIRQSFNHDKDLVVINWLPPFHDMGLIGNLLQPLYVGGCSVIMHPNTFLRSPFIWLKAITEYKGITTGCPNFALDYCVEKLTEEQKKELDFSSLKVMFCGSERVRKQSLDRFYDVFKDQGFEYRSFLPCYGLAESTLMASGIDAKERPMYINISRSEVERNSRIVFSENPEDRLHAVGCGHSWNDDEIKIVEPDQQLELPGDRIGEIWVKGISVCQGYWGKPETSKEIFHAKFEGNTIDNWLRTGDLGFIHQEQLFITGRRKDLIIIRGMNYFPDYIEEVVENCHPALQTGGCAVFSIEEEEQERLVVMQEIKRTAIRDLNETDVFNAIREAVSKEFEIPVFAIRLLKPGRLPKTTSGKTQRHLCKKLYYEE